MKKVRAIAVIVLLAVACRAFWPGIFLSPRAAATRSTAGSQGPVILDFTATWCEPCRSMAPVVESLSKSGLRFRAVDVDQEKALAAQYQVAAVPCFVALSAAGEEVGRITGATGPSDLRRLYAAARGTTAQRPITAGTNPAIVRILNETGRDLCWGSGTLVDKNADHGLIASCAHLFERGVGEITVYFPSGKAYRAKLLGVDHDGCDLAALMIVAPEVDPVPVAEGDPASGSSLLFAGYGEQGQYRAAPGRMIDFRTLNNAKTSDVAELTGAARQGDSGGPVFDDRGHLCGVLFGTNGQVVDCTCCKRLRKFLARFSLRFHIGVAPAAPAVVAAPALPPVVVAAPPGAPAPNAPPAPLFEPNQGPLQSLKDELAKAKADLAQANAALKNGLPEINLPVPPLPADPAEKVVASGAAALLTALGMGAGPAGWIASVVLPVLGAGALKGLQKLTAKPTVPTQAATQLSNQPVQPTLAVAPAAVPATLTTPAPTPAAVPATLTTPAPTPAAVPVVTQNNQFVPYETSTVDAAWSQAHSIVGAKYPGAIPYLNIVQGLKNQLLSGGTPGTT